MAVVVDKQQTVSSTYYGKFGTNGTSKLSQSWTTSVGVTNVTSIVKWLKQDSPAPDGNVQMDIYAADGSHLPTGSSLGSVSYACSTISTDAPGASFTFTFASPITVSALTEYCMVMTTPGITTGNVRDYGEATPTSGTWAYYDGSWHAYTENDYFIVYTDPTLATQLVSYWKLDESSGNASDSVGSNTLTNTNTVTYSPGKINNAATFSSGGTMYYTLAVGSENPSLEITGALSYQCWFKKTGSGPDINPLLYSGDRDAQTNQGPFMSWIDCSTGRARAAVNNSTTAKFTPDSGASLLDNQWHHMVVVFVPSTSITVWIDGSSYGTNTTSIIASQQAAGKPFEIGHRLQVGVDRYYGDGGDGQIDEVAVWSRSLSSDEITTLYNGGAGLQYPFSSSTSVITPISTLAYMGAG